jgi:hypothetical protein
VESFMLLLLRPPPFYWITPRRSSSVFPVMAATPARTIPLSLVGNYILITGCTTKRKTG